MITPRVPLEQNLAEQSTVTGQPVDEARREALKTFGRYAAAAPTAMLLLAPRQGHAGPGDKDEKDKDKKEKDEKDKGGYH